MQNTLFYIFYILCTYHCTRNYLFSGYINRDSLYINKKRIMKILHNYINYTNSRRSFNTHRNHRAHLKYKFSRAIYLREGNKSRFLAVEEIPKPLIKRVDGFKLLIRKFALCTPCGAKRNAPVVTSGVNTRSKNTQREKVTGNGAARWCAAVCVRKPERRKVPRSASAEDIDHETFAWKFLAARR